MEKKNKIDGLIEGAIKSLCDLVNVNTVVGEPILTKKGCIIPISKVAVGYITGGGEYGDVKYFKKDLEHPLSGGSGAIVSLKPVAFLIDNGNGYRLIPTCNDGFDKLLSICEEAISSLCNNDEK